MTTEDIKKVSGLIKDVVYIAGLVFAIYLFIGKTAVNKDREIQSSIALINDVQRNNVTDSIIISKFNDLNSRFDNMSDTLKILIWKNNVVIAKQNKTDKAVIELYKSTGNVEQLINWLLP